jgi:DNA-binding NtrC family response regulator
MRILVVDDDALIRKTLRAAIESDGSHSVSSASSLDEAFQILEREVFDVVFTDLTLDDGPDRAGIKLLKELSKRSPGTVPIAMTGHDEEALVDECLKAGACDYLLKPLDQAMLHQALRKAPAIHRVLRKTQSLKSQAGKDAPEKLELTSKSPAFNSLLEKARKLRGTGQSILIRGESGAGKEVLARYLWSLEDDETRPFIAVNCGAITATLAESELFGHKKGAFSGATDTRAGKFESAHEGDLFLDELATLSMDIQVKLLRVLSTGDITPVGQDTSKKVSCRVITATNEPLEEMIKGKTFREDLFFRVKQFTLTIPPLRERREDILDLAQQFLKASNSEKKLSRDAESLLLSYSWPGNVRELKSAIEVAAILSDTNEIGVDDIRPQLMDSTGPTLEKAIPSSGKIDEAAIQGRFNQLVRELESQLIDTAMNKCGSENAAAKYLGIPRSTLGDIRRRLAKSSK